MAFYPLLDPFWSRFPWPDRVRLMAEPMGPVTRFRMARYYAGRPAMAAHCYAIGDTLVDTGFPAARREIYEAAAAAGIRKVLLTHHHEDHAGNAGVLKNAGVEVFASAMTARLVGTDLPLPFYQHYAWGRTGPTEVQVLDEGTVAIGPHEAQILPAPGHAIDQVVFFVPDEGWLFAGDVFIHERVKIFRRDEDFAATLRTLRSLVQLDFDVLFCGHRPVASAGDEALVRKLEWLEEIEAGVRERHSAGDPVGEIVRRLRLEKRSGFRRLTMGDASAHNIVRSILHGPTPRREVLEALADFEAPAA
ncbi:MAG: MBL fold metallo-hydrolase [Acidobacteriota bacterium]